MYRPISPITQVNGYDIQPGFYQSVEIASDAESRRAFLEAFATPEQRAYNASKVTCSDCRGHGYYIYRERGALVRENVGCNTCKGIGAVPRMIGPVTELAA